MRKTTLAIVTLTIVLTSPSRAGDLNTSAALGGGLGGALGALIGSEVGGRNGAILGGGLGGALGSVVTTNGYRDKRYVERHYYYPSKRGPGRRYRRHRDWDD